MKRSPNPVRPSATISCLATGLLTGGLAASLVFFGSGSVRTFGILAAMVSASLAIWGGVRLISVTRSDDGRGLRDGAPVRQHEFTRADMIILGVALPSLAIVIAFWWKVEPWVLVAVAAFVMLLARVAWDGGRVGILERGVRLVADYSRELLDPSGHDEIESRLARATAEVGGINTSAIVRPGAALALEWIGDVQPDVRSALTNIEQVEALAASEGGSISGVPDKIVAYPLDAGRRSYLVLTADQSTRRLSDLATVARHLAEHARLLNDSHRMANELEAVAAREHDRARTDEFTGLPNRLAATEWLTEQLESRGPDSVTADCDGASPLIVAKIALIDFSDLVNVLGVEAGHSVVAQLVAQLGRIQDIMFLARTDENHFVVIAEGDAERGRDLAEIIRDTRLLAGGFDNGTGGLDRERAVGFVIAPVGGSASAEELLARAAVAARRAENTREIEVFGDDEAKGLARRAQILVKLRTAIDDQLVIPYFQPQIELATGELGGMEILARWIDPELGFVGPGEFIEIAEESRQIEALTFSILGQALDAVVEWRDRGLSAPVSINLSARSLIKKSFVTELIQTVQGRAVPLELVTAEITESTLVETAEMIHVLEGLRETGMPVSIDDFGTGYSAMRYLGLLPIDEVKADRSMIINIDEDTAPSPVLRRTIELCKKLGYKMVVEGVETDIQSAWLRTFGCELGQGYLYSKPLPRDELFPWAQAHLPLTLAPPVAMMTAGGHR